MVAIQIFHLFIAFTSSSNKFCSFLAGSDEEEKPPTPAAHVTWNNFLIGRARAMEKRKALTMEQTYVKCTIHFDGANIARVS